MKRIIGGRVTIAAALVLALGTGAALAAIPGSDGTINACYDKQSGQVRIYDPSGGPIKGCGKTEAAVRWSQTGPQGAPGPQGAQGVQGSQGDDGPQGDPGVKGDPGTFAGSFASPNGQFTLSVTDTGIVLDGPGGTITLGSTGILVDGGTIEVQSDQDVSVLVSRDLEITAGGDADLRTGGDFLLSSNRGILVKAALGFTAEATGTATLKGSTVRLNGCDGQVARTGDAVVGGLIVGGSASVCAG